MSEQTTRDGEERIGALQIYRDGSKTTDEAQLVERYLGNFLAWAAERGPNTAVADNARRAAEQMAAVYYENAVDGERERCIAIVRAHLGSDIEQVTICLRAIKNG